MADELEELTLIHLWRAMRAMSRRLDRRLAELRLRTREFGLLLLLRQGGRLSQRALGQAMNVDRSTMVACLDRLEAAGYVRRRAHPADRRVNWVAMTAAGRGALRRAVAAAGELEQGLWADGAAARRALVVAELRRLAAAAGGAEAKR